MLFKYILVHMLPLSEIRKAAMTEMDGVIREHEVYFATLAEQAERYDEMAEHMKSAALFEQELDAEEERRTRSSSLSLLLLLNSFLLFSLSLQRYICSSVAHHPPPGDGHGLPPSPAVDLWWLWMGVNAG